MIKNALGGSVARVNFELPSSVAADSVSVCGDFNDWLPGAQPLARLEGGGFRAVLELPTGRRWRFRYLLDGGRWENDWTADDYVPNQHGSHDSVVDLTAGALPLATTEQEPTAGNDRDGNQDVLQAGVEQASPVSLVTATSGEVAAPVVNPRSTARTSATARTKPAAKGKDSSAAGSATSTTRKRVAAESSGSHTAAAKAPARTRKSAAGSVTEPQSAADPGAKVAKLAAGATSSATSSRRGTAKKPTE